MHELVEPTSLSSLIHWRKRDAPLHGTLIDLVALDESLCRLVIRLLSARQRDMFAFSGLFSCILHHFLQPALNLGPLSSEPKGHN